MPPTNSRSWQTFSRPDRHAEQTPQGTWGFTADEAADGAEALEKVTAFRPEMSVHGRFGQPCPRCGAPIQRIRYADNETNYCPRCQTDGKLLADRALSRLLKQDWPKSIDELTWS